MDSKRIYLGFMLIVTMLVVAVIVLPSALEKIIGAINENETAAETKEPVIYKGVVQDKYFQKGEVSTGVGMGADGKTVVTTSSTYDTYTIFVNDENYEITKEVWLKLEKGQQITYEKGFFGGLKNIKLVDEKK